MQELFIVMPFSISSGRLRAKEKLNLDCQYKRYTYLKLILNIWTWGLHRKIQHYVWFENLHVSMKLTWIIWDTASIKIIGLCMSYYQQNKSIPQCFFINNNDNNKIIKFINFIAAINIYNRVYIYYRIHIHI